MELWGNITGFVKYKVAAKNNEKLIDVLKLCCPLRKIDVCEDGSLSFCCFYGYRKKADEILEKMQALTLEKKNAGLIPFLSRYKKRHGLFIGAFILVFTVFFSSFFVWEIRVEGNENVRDEEIIKVLENVGFHEGMLKGSLDVKSIVNRYLINEDRISWMAINLDGTVAHVEVREAKIWNTQTPKKNVNLVASHSGIIMRVDALDGKARVQKGDTVTKGQLLVSAFVDKRTGGELLHGARGYVFAYTERCYKVYVPLEYRTAQSTGNETKYHSISFFDIKIPLSFGKDEGYENSLISKGEKRIRLNEKSSLPIVLNNKTFSEFESSTVTRSESLALETARKVSEKRLYEASPEFTLADKDEEYSVEDGVLVYTVKYCGIEDIAGELEFELS